jgi:integrase
MINRWNISCFDELPTKLLTDKKLGAVTFNDRLSILKRFTKWAIKQKYIKKCPFEDVSRRRNDSINTKREPYSDQELIALLTYFYQDTYLRKYYYPFLQFMTLSGTRNGEATGLKVNMVDFFNKQIFICKSFSRMENGKRVLKSPKTASGNRYIPLTSELETLLSPICSRKKPNDFVFTTRYNNPIDDRQFQTRILKPALRKLRIPERDLYACRHTFGTIAIEQNMDILSVAYLMGHRKARTVLDHYAKIRNKPKTLPRITGLDQIS